MRVFAIVALAASASGSLLKTETKAAGPGNVFLSDTQVYGAGVEGAADLDECKLLPPNIVASTSEPRFKVCGQSVKVSLYALNDCKPYKVVEIGHCDPTQAADACHELGPGADMAVTGMNHFQSYVVEACGKATSWKLAASKKVSPRLILNAVVMEERHAIRLQVQGANQLSVAFINS